MEFKKLWDDQVHQQLNWYNNDSLTELERSRIKKELLLGLYEEVGELAREVDKDRYHMLRNSETIKSNVIEQGVDSFKMLMSIMQLCSVSYDEFVDVFESKTKIVQKKWQGQHLQLVEGTKLIVSDLDGCIVDISEFTDYLDEFRLENDQKGTQAALEAVKSKFYVNGGFLSLPPIKGAVEACKRIKELGYTLIIVTARPYWQYRRLYGDTMQWCEKNGIVYDHILFNKDKAEAVWENLHPARPKWFIEDRAKHALELTDIGVPVLLFDNGSNHNVSSKLITHVYDWSDVLSIIENGK